MIKAAQFSEDRKYRYSLTRIWDGASGAPLLGMIGKNPSKADEERDDPTIGKEVALGKRLGCRGLFKVNMYDYIATDSDDLLNISDSLRVSDKGLVANIVQMLVANNCRPVICCWGTHSNSRLKEAIKARGDMIRRKLIEVGLEPMCLKRNADGTPAHPLYLPKLELIAY
jgi:hypothetical protein